MDLRKLSFPVIRSTPEAIAPVSKKKAAKQPSLISRITQKVTHIFTPTPLSATVGSAVGWYSNRFIVLHAPGFLLWLTKKTLAEEAEKNFGEYVGKENASSMGSLFGSLTAPFYLNEVNDWFIYGFTGGTTLLSIAAVNHWFKDKKAEEKVIEAELTPKISQEMSAEKINNRLVKRTTTIRHIKVNKSDIANLPTTSAA